MAAAAPEQCKRNCSRRKEQQNYQHAAIVVCRAQHARRPVDPSSGPVPCVGPQLGQALLPRKRPVALPPATFLPSQRSPAMQLDQAARPLGAWPRPAPRRGGSVPTASPQLFSRHPAAHGLPKAAPQPALRASLCAAAGSRVGGESSGGEDGGCAGANVTTLPPVVNWHLEARCNYGRKFCFATFEDVKAAVGEQAASRRIQAWRPAASSCWPFRRCWRCRA